MKRHLGWVVATCLTCACAADETQDFRTDPYAEPSLPDAGGDKEPACQPEFGHTYIIDSLEVLPFGEGRDLNGDGTADNTMGLFADAVNPGSAESIALGYTTWLLDLTEWSTTPTDPDLQVTVYWGTDEDYPAAPENNLAGEGRFLVSTAQFDLACQTDTRFERASMADGVLTADMRLWEHRWEDWGTIAIADFHVELGLSDDYSRISGQASGVFTLCGLSSTYFPGRIEGSLLYFIANAIHLQPDIDRDGDGLEQVEGDGTGIAHCTDGDGTVIQGADCACDPRIADGLSVAFEISAITAHIVGVIDTP